jgi:U4/U6 small nuclear ribonucleoprotein PRP31
LVILKKKGVAFTATQTHCTSAPHAHKQNKQPLDNNYQQPATMATIADAFLADFEDDSDEEEEEVTAQQQDEEEKGGDQTGAAAQAPPAAAALADAEVEEFDFGDEDGDGDGDGDDDGNGGGDATMSTASSSAAVKAPSGADAFDAELGAHLTLLHAFTTAEAAAVASNQAEAYAAETADRQHELVVLSNALTTRVDDAVADTFKQSRDVYANRFKELEELVPNALEWARCVKVIGNLRDTSSIEGQLLGIVASHTVLTISVTATTTAGRSLTGDEETRVNALCDDMLRLDAAKVRMFAFIETRMTTVAPNVAMIVGPGVAARLLATTGGIVALSKIPACNLQVLGDKEAVRAGMAYQGNEQHAGLIRHSPLVVATPVSLRAKAVKLVAAKLALAARVDASRRDRDGSMGRQLREGIEAKIEKWQEPPPGATLKALPLPKEYKKKRAGKRFTARKNKLKMSELAKQQNRLQMGAKEEGDDYTGVGYGMIGASGVGGKLAVKRKPTTQQSHQLSKKTRKELARGMQQGAAGVAAAATAATASSVNTGLQSTIAFTEVQGMSLVNPNAAKVAARDSNNRYFAADASFTKRR